MWDRLYLITDLGLEYLANGDLKICLRTLVLSKCDRITDDGISHLKQMVCLVLLDLSDCGVNITGSHILNIKTLCLCRLIKLTVDALFGIAKCLKLTELNLTGCKAITGKGLRAFAHHPTLAKFEVSSCHNYSWEDLKSVALTSTNLGSIHLDRRIKRPMPERQRCIEFGMLLVFFSVFVIIELVLSFAVAFVVALAFPSIRGVSDGRYVGKPSIYRSPLATSSEAMESSSTIFCRVKCWKNASRYVQNGDSVNKISSLEEGSSGIDDEVVQEKRQRDNDVVHDERHHKPEKEDVEPKRCQRAIIEKSFGPDFVSFMVESE
ncbi:leucine-rich repeat, cysteine-containing subtype protein [Tanacetum coccineum]